MESIKSRTAPWCVLVVAWLAFLLSYVDRFAWPPVMAQASKDLGLSGIQAGSYMSAFFIGYIATQLPAGYLIDRYGYRRVLLGCFLLMGIFTAALGGVGGFAWGFIFRVFAGVGSGAVFAASVAAVCDWFEPHRRAFAMGLFQMGSSLGLAFANFFLPAVAASEGWRHAVVYAGLMSVICFLPASLLLRSTKKSSNAAPSLGFRVQLVETIRNTRVRVVAAIGFLALWATIGTGAWANAFMTKKLGVSAVDAGRLMMTYGLITIISMPMLGFLGDRWPRHRSLVLGLSLAAFAGLLVAFGFNEQPGILPFLVPCLGAFALGYYPVLTTMLGEAARTSGVGFTTALVNAVWQLGAFFSPMVVGLIVDRTQNFAVAFCVLAAAPVLAILILVLSNIASSRRVSMSSPIASGSHEQ